MASSTIPAFTDALLARLRARPALKNVQVTDGPPNPGQADLREWIMIGDCQGSQRAVALGAKHREEDYTCKVHVWVRQARRADQTTVNKRAFALMAEIENALRPDFNLDNTVRWVQVEGQINLQKYDSNQASERLAILTFDLWVRARI